MNAYISAQSDLNWLDHVLATISVPSNGTTIDLLHGSGAILFKAKDIEYLVQHEDGIYFAGNNKKYYITRENMSQLPMNVLIDFIGGFFQSEMGNASSSAEYLKLLEWASTCACPKDIVESTVFKNDLFGFIERLVVNEAYLEARVA